MPTQRKCVKSYTVGTCKEVERASCCHHQPKQERVDPITQRTTSKYSLSPSGVVKSELEGKGPQLLSRSRRCFWTRWGLLVRFVTFSGGAVRTEGAQRPAPWTPHQNLGEQKQGLISI